MSKTVTKVSKPMTQTKGDRIISMLQPKAGASIADLVKAIGWQKHSIQGFMPGTLKKKCSISIANVKEENKDRSYFIVEQTR